MKQWDLVSCEEDGSWDWARTPRPGDIIEISEAQEYGNFYVFSAVCIDVKEEDSTSSSSMKGIIYLYRSQILRRWFSPYEVFIRELRETCDE